MTVDKDIERNDFHNTSHFSVDLQAQAKKHLVFLHALHKLGITTQLLVESSLDKDVRKYHQTLKKLGVRTMDFCGDDRAFVNHSVRRYSELWLPLVAEAQKRKLPVIPPPDIAWMWHCHRLAPYRYAEHVQDLFGSFDATHPFVFQLASDADDAATSAAARQKPSFNETWPDEESQAYAAIARATRDLFRDLYPGESFFAGGKPKTTTTQESLLLSGFDVVAACQRQATFLWQVSGPQFSDRAFLKEGIDNYLRFVKLTNHPQRRLFQRTNQMWLVPTYQIDCLWHTHILSGIQAYHTDVKTITGGAILDHDDSINDRKEGGVLDTSFQQTKKLWKQVYGLEYFVQGGMYHGEPPAEFYRRDCFVPLSLRSELVTNIVAQSLVSNNNKNREASSVWTTNEWMPPDHALAFIPIRKTGFGTISLRDNRYTEGYVFGYGDKGLGYYNMKTRQSIDVLMDRCQRRMRRSKSRQWAWAIMFLGFQFGFFGTLTADGPASMEPAVWFFYIVIGCIILPTRFFMDHKERCRCAEIHDNAKRYSDAERGGYTLHDNEMPDARDLAGAAACGFSLIYRGGATSSGSGCGGGACVGGGGESGWMYHAGGGCGGGGCVGGGCGGGGCGGGGCGG